MENLLGVRNELGEGFTWSIVRMMLDREPKNSEDLHESTVCNSKVAVAWTIMDEFLAKFRSIIALALTSFKVSSTIASKHALYILLLNLSVSVASSLISPSMLH